MIKSTRYDVTQILPPGTSRDQAEARQKELQERYRVEGGVVADVSGGGIEVTVWPCKSEFRQHDLGRTRGENKSRCRGGVCERSR